MQFTVYDKKKNINDQFAEAIDDINYATVKSNQLGLAEINAPIMEIQQEKETQEFCKSLIDWVRVNVADYRYTEVIIQKINYILKYGVSTLSHEGGITQLIGNIVDGERKYTLYITFSLNALTILSDSNTKSKSVVNNLCVALDPDCVCADCRDIESCIDDTEITTRFYSIDNKVFRHTNSNQQVSYYTNGNDNKKRIVYSVRNKNEKTEHLDKEQNIVTKNDMVTTTYIPTISNIIACKSQSQHYSIERKDTVIYDCSYYLTRDTSPTPIRIVTDSTKCPVSPDKFLKTISGNCESVEKDIQEYEEEYFAKIISFDKRKI